MTKLFPISRFTVYGNSMNPVLKQGQDVLSFNWAYLGNKPQIGDVVVVSMAGKEIIKRVQKVEGNDVFVAGDNKEQSTDSRHFGPIDLEQIVGKVIYPTKIDCPSCGLSMIGIAGRKDASCGNCGFKLTCCGEP